MSSTYNINDYKVGIICALPKERTAVEAMLDEIHDLQLDVPGDDNVYTFGSFVKSGIVKHNVVVASLGKGSYGVVSAAQVARDIRRSFPHLKYGLMVGIAGAMARPESKEADIRLGDIVIGCANGVPSIVDYSRGQETPNGFDIRSELADPPEALAKAVSALESQHQRLGPTYLVHLANMLKRHVRYNDPRWKQNYYNLPDAADILFDSQPDECEGEDDCGACLIAGRTEVIRRPRDLPPPPDTLTSERFIRKTNGSVDYPAVFLGTIGSTHASMKSSTSRDRVFQMVKDQRKAKLLCFEMEASGIVRDWPCLVIRGICDYADSHKNDAWQNFAASTAAAYTKDLLLRIPSAAVEDANPINTVVQDAGQTPRAGTSGDRPGPLYSINRTHHHQTASNIRPNDSRPALPALSAQEQLELDRQFVTAAGAGNLDLVRSLHRRGANIDSSCGPRWAPTAITSATSAYKFLSNTMQRSSIYISSYHTKLKQYSEVIRYLYANGLDWDRQQPTTQIIIREVLEEHRY